MGELFAYYAAADVVFVGGSLVDTGCQNVIEPIACGKPTVFGYSTYNFRPLALRLWPQVWPNKGTDASQMVHHGVGTVAKSLRTNSYATARASVYPYPSGGQ